MLWPFQHEVWLQGAGGGKAAQNKAVGLGRSSRTSAEDLINAKAAIKRASVLYSCLMPIITRYMHTTRTPLWESQQEAGSPVWCRTLETDTP